MHSFISRSLVAVVVSACLISSCNRHSGISEYPPFIDLPFDERVAGVPIILVGRVTGSSAVGKPRRSVWGASGEVQMYRVNVSVENLLKGDLSEKNIPVFYFVRWGAWEGPPRLGSWRIGDREMFFLQSNAGVLRTICDNYQHCVLPVFTGAHPGWSPDPKTGVGYQIIDFLLTRGKGCSDEDLIRQIQRTPSFDINNWSAIHKLEQLAENEPTAVRDEACHALNSFGDTYFRTLPDPSISLLRKACGNLLKETPFRK